MDGDAGPDSLTKSCGIAVFSLATAFACVPHQTHEQAVPVSDGGVVPTVPPSRGIEGAPEAMESGRPWAFYSGCGYIGVDKAGKIIVGTEVDGAAIWRRIESPAWPVDRVVSAANPGQAKPEIVALSFETGNASSLRISCDRGTPLGAQANPMGEAIGRRPADDQGAAYAIDGGDLVVVGACDWTPGRMCLRKWSRGVDRGDVVEALAALPPYVEFEDFGLLWNERAVRAVTSDGLGRSLLSIAMVGGDAGNAKLLGNSLLLPDRDASTSDTCRVAILPSEQETAKEAGYVALCYAPGVVRTVVGWLGLDSGGEQLGEMHWQQDGGLPAGIPPLGGAPFASFGSDAERIAGLYMGGGARSVRGVGSMWLVSRYRAAGPTNLFVTCLPDVGVPRTHVVTAEGPLGLRADGSDLIVLDASHSRHLPCR